MKGIASRHDVCRTECVGDCRFVKLVMHLWPSAEELSDFINIFLRHGAGMAHVPPGPHANAMQIN
jgi:hypothetical protein